MVPERSPRLTQSVVDKATLPPGKADHFIWDSDIAGFGLRLRQGGSRNDVYWYRIGTRRRKMHLGAASAVTASDARKTASRLHAEVKLGHDPAGEKAVNVARAAETVGAVLPRYLERQRKRLRPRAYVEVERHLGVHAKRLHLQPLAGVTRRDVAATLSALEADMSGATVNRVRSSLSGFFMWCIREGLIESNVAAFTDKRPEESRSRVLTDDELSRIGQALRDDAYGDVVRLLILTGSRREEIGALLWSEVDLDAGVIALPPARTKTKRPHEIPLSPAALDVIRNRPHFGDYVFGGKRGFQDWGASKAALDGRIAPPLPAWVLHDFRRTISTVMHERLGIEPHIVEAVLGHVGHRAGVAGVYNRSVYSEQKRAALQAWADHVGGIVVNA
jgi:integrase